jgi:hypothetical protein
MLCQTMKVERQNRTVNVIIRVDRDCIGGRAAAQANDYCSTYEFAHYTPRPPCPLSIGSRLRFVVFPFY